MSYEGECVVTTLTLQNYTRDVYGIRIDRADKCVKIAVLLLEDVRNSPTQTYWCDGDLLHIHGLNRHVVYRLGDKVLEHDGITEVYLAERVDA